MALTNIAFSDLITFTRASTGTFTGTNGLLQTAAIDAPRFDYNPTTFFPNGFLIEEARTNLFFYSEQFDNAYWTKSATTITISAAVAPSGVADADGLIEDTATSAHSTSRVISFTSGAFYSVSIFAKEIPGSAKRYLSLTFPSAAFTSNLAAVFDLSAGVSTTVSANATASILPVGNGWYRCSITATATITASASSTIRLSNVSTSGLPAYAGDGTSGLYIWGAQLEVGAFVTSYIPTTAAAATRNADVASINTLSPWYNATEGTLFVQTISLMSNTLNENRPVAAFSDNTYSNLIYIVKANGAALWTNQIVNGGTAQATLSFAYVQNNNAKLTLAYALNNVNAAVNGLVGTTDTSATIPTVTTLKFYDPTGAAGGQPTMYLQKVSYYPQRLTNLQLQALTS
jgi:hypothetical protein